MKKLFLLLVFFAASFLYPNLPFCPFQDAKSGWNSSWLAKMYFHHSEMQRQWAWELLGKIPLEGTERILDFGCGDGKISAELARRVFRGQVMGVDISEEMLHLAKIHFPSYAYPNLQFKKSSSLLFDELPGEEKYDLICSFSAFHLLPSPVEILKNLKTHLQPKGKLLITLPTGKNPFFFQAAKEAFAKHQLTSPWDKGVLTGPSMRTLEGCSVILQEAGYEILSLELIDTDNAFLDLDDLISWMVGTATANWEVPVPLSQAFFTDVVSRMCELNPEMIDQEGWIRFQMPRIHIIAKPK